MSVGRKVSQEGSRTAIVATIAAELVGIPGDDQPEWFRSRLGIAIGAKGRKMALHRRKQLSPHDAKKGRRAPSVVPAGSEGWVWDAMAVDLHELDLERALVVFDAVPEPKLLVEQLRQLLGVTEVIETYGDGHLRRVVARVLYLGARRRAQLDAALRATQVPFEWLEIHREVPSRPFAPTPAAATWGGLARQIAEMEGHTT
jgi:hypothetical protein